MWEPSNEGDLPTVARSLVLRRDYVGKVSQGA